MSPVIAAIVIFFVVSGMVGALALLFRGNRSERVNERLDQLVGRAAKKESSTDLLIKQAMNELDGKSLMERLTPEIFKLTKMFEQADVSIRPSMLFGIALGLGFLCAMGATVGLNLYVAPVAGVIGFMLPFGWLWFKRGRRLNKFAAQLPDAMELIARALRAGHSLASGLHVVAEEMPLPISKEFGRIYEEQNLGIPIEDALKSIMNRVPNLDLRFFVTSVAIQRQTGGDLAEILDRIGHVIRERFKILGQVKALTAEGRLSGIVLIALPIGLFLMMLSIKPDYISALWTDPMGVKMSIAAIVLIVIGAIAIKKIITIKV